MEAGGQARRLRHQRSCGERGGDDGDAEGSQGEGHGAAALAVEEPSLEFVDLFPSFADAGGKTRAELFLEDGMHFMRAGLRHRRGSAEARLVLSHESRQLPSWLICNGRHKSHG